MRRTIALVACVAKKQPTPRPAQDLYCSAWFRKASAYASRVADGWYILSAKHGLVPPDRIIAPYNETLKTMPAAARRAWAEGVLDDLDAVLKPSDHLMILAGQDYRTFLVASLQQRGFIVNVPMEGLRIGEQMSWLKRRLERISACP